VINAERERKQAATQSIAARKTLLPLVSMLRVETHPRALRIFTSYGIERYIYLSTYSDKRGAGKETGCNAEHCYQEKGT
jgi:hypothetical protein